jgi:L-alanine-DL-glutamate epimerase-like enolase superfamily enzyme
MPNGETIERFHIRRLSITPAISLPERLSDVKDLDVVLIETWGESGRVGYGDALLIPGETPETIEQAWMIACKLAEVSVGMAMADAIDLYAPSHSVAPHTVTALTVAIEVAAGAFVFDTPLSVPLVGVLDASDPVTFDDSLAEVVQAGYDTARLTLSGDLAVDRVAIIKAQSALGGSMGLRLDGNQAFMLEDAVSFVRSLDPSGIEWLAQPCVAGDWEAATTVKDASEIPMVVSGFLYNTEDIRIAAAMGAADIIGLKFGQIGGFSALQRVLNTAGENGLGVFLGGGLQSDLSALWEACALVSHATLISDLTAIGIAVEPLLAMGISRTNGAASAEVHGQPVLSPETLELCCIQELSF